MEQLESRPGEPYPTGGVLRIFRAADAESSRVNHSFIGTEHLLLGMIKVDWMSPLSDVTGLELNKLRGRLISIIGMGVRRLSPENPTLTPNVNLVLRAAKMSAIQDHFPFYDSAHLLGGMMFVYTVRKTSGGELLGIDNIERLKRSVNEGGILEDIRKREMQFPR